MTTSRRVNPDLKRDHLPSGVTLGAARDGIVDWWQAAWLADEALGACFRRECAAALPMGVDAGANETFDGLVWRHLRLRRDQQVPERVRRSETSREPADA